MNLLTLALSVLLKTLCKIHIYIHIIPQIGEQRNKTLPGLLVPKRIGTKDTWYPTGLMIIVWKVIAIYK